MKTAKRIFSVGIVAAALLVSAGTATAKDGDIIRRGQCSGASDWKLKLSRENGRIEVEYEVDANVVGQTWRVRLFHNGDRIFLGERTTKGPSRSFEVRRVVDDLAGDDVLRGRARNLQTDETCGGRAVWPS